MTDLQRSLPLVCLPFAGGGASTFRDWPRLASGAFDVVPVQLPGRENLIDEEPYCDAAQAVAGILPQVSSRLAGRKQVVLFGHSMGAVLAYELAHRLVDRGAGVELLVVSGSHGPFDRRPDRVAGLPDEEFIAGLHRFAGYRPPALEDPEFRELMLPILRADAMLHESYRPASSAPLGAPILSLRGSDDAVVTAQEAAGWQAATIQPLRTAELPGGHMYLTGSTAAILDLIRADVYQPSGACGS